MRSKRFLQKNLRSNVTIIDKVRITTIRESLNIKFEQQ